MFEAQVYYANALGLHRTGVAYGLVNSAPYLCCTFSCLMTYHVNLVLGRRGTIFLTCFISFITCLAQAFVQSWQTLFIARFMLGFGIGIKSATIPIYSAECAPANIRGALVMMWQVRTYPAYEPLYRCANVCTKVWTAFGIMLGYISGVLLQNTSAGGQPAKVTKEHPHSHVYRIINSCRGTQFPDGTSDAQTLRTLHCVSFHPNVCLHTNHKLNVTESQLASDAGKPVSTSSKNV